MPAPSPLSPFLPSSLQSSIQVELALSAEELFPKKIRRWFIIGKREVKPNRPLSVFEYFRYFIWGSTRHDSAENIDNALHPPLVRAHLP